MTMNRLVRGLAVVLVAGTLAAIPAVASGNHGGSHCNNGVGNGPDCRPGRAQFSNDDHGGSIGSPGVSDFCTEYRTDQKGDNTIKCE